MIPSSDSQTLELAAHLDDATAEAFERWAWRFVDFGTDTALRATLAAARLALPAWLDYRPSDEFDRGVLSGPLVADAIVFVDRQLDSGLAPEAEAISLRSALEQLVGRARFYVDEASGDAEQVSARSRALSAATAALAMVQVLTWTEADAARDTSDAQDQAELRARIAAGPALHVVEAFAHACHASQIDAARLRAELRTALLGAPRA